LNHGTSLPLPAELRKRAVRIIAEVRPGYDTE
jgi:hypothetical protein